jgi:Na+/H+-dicarboxylate symporter
VLKPIGDIFLNLLFVAVIPLVFFAIASAIANMQSAQKLSRIMGVMSGVFLLTIIMAALLTIFALWLFPVGQSAFTSGALSPDAGKRLSGDEITQLFTTSEFFNLLSRKNMLAMIIFAILVGFGALRAGEKGKAFTQFLNAGNEVFKQVFSIIMKAGPGSRVRAYIVWYLWPYTRDRLWCKPGLLCLILQPVCLYSRRYQRH